MIVEAEQGVAVHLGWREEVDGSSIARLVESQDAHAMLRALNRVPVATGDAIYVPAGTPHASGEGILVASCQS